MSKPLAVARRLHESLAQLDRSAPQYVPAFVDAILAASQEVGASDLHVQPTAEAVEIHWRIDGVLQELGRWPGELAPNLVARLKILADLLTYRNDVPQEGRIRHGETQVEMRVASFPTIFGERVVVRFFHGSGQLLRLADLGLPAEILHTLSLLLRETSGAILVAGPAGSGKTTTIYACLRELVARTNGGRSLVSLEDPVEVPLAGVAQSQVNPSAGFDLASGLRSVMRQDPEVIMIGEIRDRATAEGAFQASLTGHLVLSTVHAGSAAGVISRLSDMGIEPYLLRSGILAIISQRLVRTLCGCSRPSTDEAEALGIGVQQFRVPVGCDSCGGTGYSGRQLLAEMLVPEPTELGRAILSRCEASRLEELAIQAGMVTRFQRALAAIEAGQTSPAESRRVLGFSQWPARPGRPAPH